MVKPGSEYVFGGYVYERFSRENTESYAKDYIKGGWEWAPAELGRPNLSDEKYKQVHPVPYAVEYEIDNVKVSAILQFRRDETQSARLHNDLFSVQKSSVMLKFNGV